MKTENHLLPCLMALMGTSSSLCAAWISPLPIYICCPSSSCPHWWVKGNSSASWPHPCFYSPGCCWLLHGLLPISTLVISLELFTNKLVSDRTVSRNYSFPKNDFAYLLVGFPAILLAHSLRMSRSLWKAAQLLSVLPRWPVWCHLQMWCECSSSTPSVYWWRC